MILVLSIVFNSGIVSVNADSLGNISIIPKYQIEICNALNKNEIIDDEKLIVEIGSKATEKQIKNALNGVAKKYEVISGKFEIDESLPRKKKERLKKYVESERYTTILEVDLKDNVEINEARDTLESKSIVDEVDYNYGLASIESYGVDDTYSGNQYYLSNIRAKTA